MKKPTVTNLINSYLHIDEVPEGYAVKWQNVLLRVCHRRDLAYAYVLESAAQDISDRAAEAGVDVRELLRQWANEPKKENAMPRWKKNSKCWVKAGEKILPGIVVQSCGDQVLVHTEVGRFYTDRRDLTRRKEQAKKRDIRQAIPQEIHEKAEKMAEEKIEKMKKTAEQAVLEGQPATIVMDEPEASDRPTFEEVEQMFKDLFVCEIPTWMADAARERLAVMLHEGIA